MADQDEKENGLESDTEEIIIVVYDDYETSTNEDNNWSCIDDIPLPTNIEKILDDPEVLFINFDGDNLEDDDDQNLIKWEDDSPEVLQEESVDCKREEQKECEETIEEGLQEESVDCKQEEQEECEEAIEDYKEFEEEGDFDQPEHIYIDGGLLYVEPIYKSERTSSASELALCSVCGKRVKIRSMSKHMAFHGKHSCDICSKSFKTFEEFEKHKLEHLENDHACTRCNMKFNDTLEYVYHCYKHDHVYSCVICSFTTHNKSSIKGHILRHEKKYTHYCDICGKGFLGKTLLDSHKEVHLDIKRYSCSICDKKFAVKRYLQSHVNLNHRKELYGDDQLFQCEVCGREFTFLKSLLRHQSIIHHIGEDRTVECPVCHKMIANAYNLKMHMRIHTGEKNFCCDLCGKAFSAHKYWKKHKQLHEMQSSKDPGDIEKIEDLVDFGALSDMDDLEIDHADFIMDIEQLD
uniref:Zinc finger protein OZF-like isoform X2 n=1 Tax=Diabrotica virgifera virgifera TaxID=50390 RepID=A0A6P7F4S0_DIAVI